MFMNAGKNKKITAALTFLNAEKNKNITAALTFMNADSRDRRM